MKLIQENPYRIIGVLANSTTKVIQSRKNKIQAFARVGKPVTSEYDFPFLEPAQRDETRINKAFSAIEQNRDKVTHSLFWFINQSPIDDLALQHLISGNKEKAIEIWEKLTDGKEVTAKNFSAFNNISTIYFLEKNEQKIKKGVTNKIRLIESESFPDFLHTVVDKTFSVAPNKQIKLFIDELLVQFKGKYSTTQVIELFGNCNGTTQKHLSKKFTEEPIHIVESQIEKAKKERIENQSNAYKIAVDLYNNTKRDVNLLKSILGADNLQYKILADNVARELLQCSIDYFNESQKQENGNNYLEGAMSLAKIAKSVAVGDVAKNKIKENLKILEEMKDKELSEVIMFLKSVKETYQENERKIRREVKMMEETDILLKMGHKSINWDAVEDNIKNSINWGKVNDLLVGILTDTNLKKIKESDKTEAKKEFWELINWTKENSLKNHAVSAIIDKYKIIPPKVCFEIVSAEVTNTDSNSNVINSSFYIEDIRYIGLKLQIKSDSP